MTMLKKVVIQNKWNEWRIYFLDWNGDLNYNWLDSPPYRLWMTMLRKVVIKNERRIYIREWIRNLILDDEDSLLCISESRFNL